MAAGSDILLLRRWLHSHVDLPKGGVLVDLGSGSGDDLRSLAEERGGGGQFVGIDLNPAITRPVDERVAFVRGSLEAPLPFAPGSIDVLYSVNALECLADPAGAIARWAETLRPGGQAVFAHFDWDTQTFDGVDRGLVRKLIHAYADWQQAWMPTLDPWAGRRLWSWVQASGHFEGEIRPYTLTNTDYAEPLYGWRQARAFSALARRNLVSEQEYGTFLGEIKRLASENRYFYSVNLYAFVGRRKG